MSARLLNGTPPRLRGLVIVGAVLAFAGLILSYALSSGLYTCETDNRVTEARASLCESCAAVLERDCKRANNERRRRKNAAAALKELQDKAPEGSLEFAKNRPAVEYLQAIVDAQPSNGGERFEVWRWAGILIFVGACSGSAWLLLKQLQRAELVGEDQLPKWHWPFGLMVFFSNVANAGGTWRHDRAALAPVTWQHYCNDWLAWGVERFIVLGASGSLGFAFAALWVLGDLDLSQRIDLKHPDGACGVRQYVAILQRWSIATPILLVVPAFLWMAAEARKPDFDVGFAVVWLVVIVPMLIGVVRLIRRAQGLRSSYQLKVQAVGDYAEQQDAKLPPDPTTPLLGADGWTPITGGLALAGILWAIIEWSGGSRPLHALGW